MTLVTASDRPRRTRVRSRAGRIVRSVKIYAIAGGTVALSLVAAPAFAAPYPVPDAKNELVAAIAATNAAPSYQYLDNNLGWTAAYNAAGQYQQVTTADEQRVFNGVGNYHQIQWPSPAVEEKVTGPDYLDNLALEWELTDADSPYAVDYFPQWPYIQSEERLGRIYSLANANFITVADKSTVGADTVYRVGDGDYFEYVYTVNAGGRITRLEVTRGNRTPLTGRFETWNYVPVTVTEPDPGTALPIATVRRAIQAATLNATIRTLAKESAATGNRQRQNLRKLRVWTREDVSLENAAGDGSQDEPIPRFVRIKVANVSGGVRIYRKNPITGTKHEWRITKRGAKWKAYKTQP